MPTPLPDTLRRFADDSASLDGLTRAALLLDYADDLGDFPEDARTEANRVRGCASLVYLASAAEPTPGGPLMRYWGYADAQLVRGMVAVLVRGLDGEPAAVVAGLDPAFLRESGLTAALSPTRQGGLANILARMQADARAALAA